MRDHDPQRTTMRLKGPLPLEEDDGCHHVIARVVLATSAVDGHVGALRPRDHTPLGPDGAHIFPELDA